MQISKSQIFIIFCSCFILFSFALRAQIVPPVLNRVHIEPATQNVYLSWEASPTPGVTHYIVSIWKPTGPNNPIPTSAVPVSPPLNALEYSYPNPDVQNSSFSYTVVAFIADSSSNASNRDSTIHLSVDYDSCTARAHLQWNDYNTWRGNINRYEISIESGGVLQEQRIVPASLTDTTITLPPGNDTYDIFVTAYKDSGNPDDYSSSNKVEVPTAHASYPEYIFANFGTVGAANQAEMKFTIDPNSELTDYVLFRSDNADSFTDSIAVFTTQEKTIEYTDNVDAAQRAYYYQLVAVNFCATYLSFSDNIAGTIHLSADLIEYTVNLSWNEYKRWIGGVERYEIQRMLNGESFETIGETAEPSYTDNSLESLPGQAYSSEVCYRIIAYERPGNPYTTELETSTSIIVCVRLPASVTFNDVDAFIPGHADVGTFGPEMDFTPANFSFKIYNRWGNLVFETSDATNPDWDGQTGNGTTAPEGVYRYQLQYSDENGESVIQHGNVTVVRQ